MVYSLTVLLLLPLSLLLSLASSLTPPLSTSTRYIVDSTGERVKLGCVSWAGAHQKDYVVGGLHRNTITAIAGQVASLGFNCVRLQWSLEMYFSNPRLEGEALAAMPELVGVRALDAYEMVVQALTQVGVMVILDNHISDANWCCSSSDGNGLHWTANYPEEQFFEAWRGMVARFSKYPLVVAADLRNEVRITTISGKKYTPTWGGGDSKTDWHRAASIVAEEILKINPNLIIFVQGIDYALDLSNVRNVPIVLSVPNKLVYSSHDYSWSHGDINWDKETEDTYQKYREKLDRKWGYIFQETGQKYSAPVWLGETGTAHNEGGMDFYWSCVRRYLRENDLDWSYWSLDGTQSTGDGREFGAEETFGVLNMAWNAPAYEPHIRSIQELLGQRFNASSF